MTLNLVKKELSDIDYKIFTFPDGEIQIELLSDIKDSIVDIECRITCANDLFILLQVINVISFIFPSSIGVILSEITSYLSYTLSRLYRLFYKA